MDRTIVPKAFPELSDLELVLVMGSIAEMYSRPPHSSALGQRAQLRTALMEAVTLVVASDLDDAETSVSDVATDLVFRLIEEFKLRHPEAVQQVEVPSA